jgi:hypothetical protein
MQHGPKEELRVSLELFNVPLAGLGEAMQYGEDAHGSVAVETADVGARARSDQAIFFTPSLSAS